MRVGGKRRLEIPPELAFGEEGQLGVAPNTAVTIEVELVDVTAPPHLAHLKDLEPVVTASGLKYWDIKEGDGPSPAPTSSLTLRQTGWLTTGKVFDSSKDHGGKQTITLNRAIKGWQEGLLSMKQGGVRWLEVPSELGFGSRGWYGVPGDSILFFKIELLKVHAPPHLAGVEGIEPITSQTGLRYWDIKGGSGPSPQPWSTIKVHYNGWRNDGSMFDSTYARNEPLTLAFSDAIPGLREGLRPMRVGGKRWLEVPPHLAFGDAGHPQNGIGPGETLYFELELVGVE
jgi:peptidylprolyl isomerase